MSTPFFTVFTPAYNCEATIHKVFKSVAEQTFRNFEWIIINDGSKDNSSQVIKRLIEEIGTSDIQITFLEFENNGKHSVWNKGVALGKGKFFVPADADDSFLPETLDFFYSKITTLSEDELQKISGINVLCFDNDSDNIVGDQYPEDGMLSSNFDLDFKLKVKDEKWGCVKLDLLKKFPFPEINNEYFPEGYIFYALSKTHQLICYNKPLRRYYTSNNGISATNSKGNFRSINKRKVTIIYYSWLLDEFGFKILRYSPIRFFRIVTRIAVDKAYLRFNN